MSKFECLQAGRKPVVFTACRSGIFETVAVVAVEGHQGAKKHMSVFHNRNIPNGVVDTSSPWLESQVTPIPGAEVACSGVCRTVNPMDIGHLVEGSKRGGFPP